MQASTKWLASRSTAFSAGVGRSGSAPLTKYTVQYREWGQGSPIILIPGLAGGYELLGPMARQLARQHRVISYHLRGEDDCFALRQRFDIDDLVSDLAEFIEWHGLEQPALCGVSFGGVLAMEYAVRYPHRVSQLVLQGVGARFEKSLFQRVAGMVLARYPLPADNPFINQFFNLLFGGRQEAGPLFDFVTSQCWKTDQGVMAHRFQLVEEYDIGDRLERILAPTLILAGERDLLVSPRSLQALQRGLADARLVRLPGAGHLAFITQAERMAREIEVFLHANATLEESLPEA